MDRQARFGIKDWKGISNEGSKKPGSKQESLGIGESAE